MASTGFPSKAAADQESMAAGCYIRTGRRHCCGHPCFQPWSQLNHWLMIYLYIKPALGMARHSSAGVPAIKANDVSSELGEFQS